MTELPPQGLAGIIVSQNPQRNRLGLECVKIIDGIRCTPRNNGRFPIVEDEHGGFAGNARNLAVNKLVCHQIAIHGNRAVAKLLDDFQISCFGGRVIGHQCELPSVLTWDHWKLLSSTKTIRSSG